MRVPACIVAGALVAVSLPFATPAHATTIAEICARAYTTTFNLPAAARVMTPNGARKPRPAGLASAQAVARLALVDTAGNPCNDPLSESVQESIGSVDELLAEGEVTAAHDYLMQLVNDLNWTPQARRQVRAGTACEGFDSHGLKLPEEVRSAIGIAQRAQALGFDDVSAAAMSQAVAITQAWGDSGADGQATSIPDWLGIASKLELIGADQSVIDRARSNMTKVAKDAYDKYNKHACHSSISDVSCFLKAAQFLAMTGSEPATFANDVAYQVTTARDRYRGKKAECPVEKYQLQITMDSQLGDGQTMHFDTGRMTLVVRDGKITSSDRGPLVIGNSPGSCWVQQESGWAKVGQGTLTGGRFPYVVSGTSDASMLHVRLIQKAKVTGHLTGDPLCEAFGQLGLQLMNSFLRGLKTSGLDLPAGEKEYEETTTTHGVFEPTGETTTDTSYVLFRQIYPKRDVPEDPYS